MKAQTVYEFGSYAPEIYADEQGKFWDKKTDRLIDTKYYNGRVCVQFGVKRYGIKKLRMNAIKLTKKIIEIPF